MTVVNPEIIAEIAPNGDPISQVAELLVNNAEAVAAGTVFFVMLGNDVLAIGTDIMADGRFDFRSSKDWIALSKGMGRVVGSGASSLALFSADPGAWALGNVSMVSYFATRPKEAGQLADLVRSYYQKSVKK